MLGAVGGFRSVTIREAESLLCHSWDRERGFSSGLRHSDTWTGESQIPDLGLCSFLFLISVFVHPRNVLD